MSKARPRIPFAAKIVLGMVAGLAAGMLWGERTAPLSLLGTTILDVIKALAGPLLLLAILDAFLRTEVRARSGGLMVAIMLFNAAFALGIGLTISNVLRPGKALDLERAGEAAFATARKEFGAMAGKVEPGRQIDFFQDLVHLIPTSVVRPFVDNAILAIVLIAVLAGASLRRVKGEQQRVGQGGYRVIEEAVATL